MTSIHRRGWIALAGVLAAAALGSATPAQAAPTGRALRAPGSSASSSASA